MASEMIFGHLLEDLADGVTVFREGVGKPMPLTSTEIVIEISAGLAVVVTTRRFSNREDVPIEAILTMPVGFNAVVTGLAVTIDGRKMRAVAKAKDAARESYETAIDDGKMAVLHEEALRGIHVLSVGQLAPGKEVAVELRMVLPLAISETGQFLRLPMTAGQLYGSTPLQPADDLTTDAEVRHTASLRVRTDAGVARLVGVGPVGPDDALTVTLDRAIEIVMEGGWFGTLSGVSADGHQVRIDLRPQEASEAPLRLAVLVDRSGSTAGFLADGKETVLTAMRQGLADALSRVTEEDHIALWQFSDDCRRLGTGRGTEVLPLLQKLSEPGGGTRLGGAIRQVAASGIKDILVLTDGQTWETLPPLAATLNIRVSAVLVGKASLDANIGHLCAMTGGDLFYAPDADIGACVGLALKGKRASAVVRELELADGRSVRVRRCIGGVEITASWSDAMELGRGSDIGRFAAGLCLGQMGEEAASALAIAEGLCSQATSLILVDEAGEASQGLSETRKVPLMAEPLPVMSVAMPQSFASPVQAYARRSGVGVYPSPDPGSTSRPSRLAVRAMASPQAPRRLPGLLDAGPDSASGSTRRSHFSIEQLAILAEGIDWDTQSNRFLAGDFTGLLTDEEEALSAMAADGSIARILELTALNPKLVLLAWLAARFVTHSRAAQRLAKKVVGALPGRDLLSEIENQILGAEARDDRSY